MHTVTVLTHNTCVLAFDNHQIARNHYFLRLTGGCLYSWVIFFMMLVVICGSSSFFSLLLLLRCWFWLRLIRMFRFIFLFLFVIALSAVSLSSLSTSSFRRVYIYTYIFLSSVLFLCEIVCLFRARGKKSFLILCHAIFVRLMNFLEFHYLFTMKFSFLKPWNT